MKDIKAVVFDLDGTLLNSDGNIEHEEKKYLEALKKKGIRIYIATGRGAEAFVILKDIIFDAIILCNGMRVYHENKQVHKEKLTREELGEFWNEIKRIGLKIGVYKQDEVGEQITAKGEEIEGGRYLYNELPEYFDKMFVEVAEYGIVQLIKKKLPKHYYIIYTKDGYAFIMPEDVSKYSGVKKILTLDNIHISNTLVFGDDENDMELIKQSGIGVAMVNALEEVKEIADYVTKSNDDNGISYMLQYLKVVNKNEK